MGDGQADAGPGLTPRRGGGAAFILSISYNEPLLHTREWMLKAEGFRVTSVSGFVDAMRRCQEGGFDLAIMGHSIPHQDQMILVKEFKQFCPAPVLSLVTHGDAPLPQADFWLEASDGPEALIGKVRAVLDDRFRTQL